MKLGHRADFVRDTHKSPPPKGYEDVNPKSFIEMKINGVPVTYHDGYYYRKSDTGNQWDSWAKRMNGGKK